nr:hypothetical protein [uncultured Prevotella sp.]
MKKLIFSIAALAAIVVMGSCSQDSDLTNTTASSKTKQDSVTIGLSINTGITVSESNSSMAKSTANVPVTRAAVATRADQTTTEANTHTTTTDFAPTYPTSYTVYFVADDGTTSSSAKQGDYTNGTIVRTITITTNSTTDITSGTPSAVDGDGKTITTSSSNSNNTETYTLSSIKIPAIKYDVYVTNYPTEEKAGDSWKNVTLPTSSTTLYLYGETPKQDLTSSSSSRTVAVTLINNYAAVAVAANDFVSGVSYLGKLNDNTYGTSTYLNNSSTATQETLGTTSWNVGGWYYLYINTTITSNQVSNKYTTNSKLTLENINGKENGSQITLSKEITAGNIYQFTINDNYTGGNWSDDGSGATGSGDGLTISVTPFTNNGTSDLSVY